MRCRTWIGLIISTIACAMLALGPLAAPESPQDEGADAGVPAPIPDDARKLVNPVPASEESIGYGKTIFASQCGMCHGTTGNGRGSLVDRLKLKVPDFTTPEHRSTRTDGELFYILTHGHGKMPGEGDRLTDKVKWDLVNAIRSFSASR